MKKYGNVNWNGAIEEKQVMRKWDYIYLWSLLAIGLMFFAGCQSGKTYYPNGQTKSEYSGCIDFSDGAGKTINLPLSNPSVIGK